MRRLIAIAVLVLISARASAQQPEVRSWTAEHQPQIFSEFLQLLSIPNVKSDTPNIRANADFLKAMLGRHGFQAQIWNTSGTPVVYGEHLVPGAKQTILFYIHYDGQPVDPSHWSQPDPFKPVLRDASLDQKGKVIEHTESLKAFPDEWRLYARSAADDKAPIAALCAAMDAIRQSPSSNIKVFLHGEEEGGGPALEDVLSQHMADLKADLMVLLDGPQHPSRRPTIFYGARGGAGLTVTVYTARMGMHSGNYGNWMPDANVRLSQLIASMVAPSGKVVIKDFYSDVPAFSAATKAMFAAVPDDSASMQREFGVGETDGAASSLQEGLNLPALSIHSMQGGEVGGVIAAKSTAQIAMRLVPENDPNAMVQRVIAHIREQGYFITDKDPDTTVLAAHKRVAKVSYRTSAESGAWRTDPELPAAGFVRNALRSVWGESVVNIRTLGGGVPASPFIHALHIPVIGIALVNYDDNQHTDNENLRLGNLWDGISTLAALLRDPGPLK